MKKTIQNILNQTPKIKDSYIIIGVENVIIVYVKLSTWDFIFHRNSIKTNIKQQLQLEISSFYRINVRLTIDDLPN